MRISDWSSDVCSSDLHGWNGEMGHCTLFEMQIAVTHAARRGPDKNLIIGGLVDLDRLDRNITAIFAEHRSAGLIRSEERRVGKECVSTGRSRWSPYH